MHEHTSARQAVETMILSGDLSGLLRAAEAVHGHLCPGVALGVKASQYALEHLSRESSGLEEVAAIIECHNCLADGVQVVTGCTLGNGHLILKDLGKMAVTVIRRRDGAAVRLSVHPDFRERMFAKYPAAGPLFDKVMIQKAGTPEDHHRFQHLWAAIARRELEAPLTEQFRVQHLTLPDPISGRSFSQTVCSRCGEGVTASRAREQEGQTLCLTCAGEEFYTLTARGIEPAR